MTPTMLFNILLICGCLLCTRAVEPTPKRPRTEGECLTGYMTDVQSWVDAYGVLNPLYVDSRNSIDLSYIRNPVPNMRKQLISQHNDVRYLSLAKCGLTRVPLVFQMEDDQGRTLAETLEYMTFYGNSFVDVSAAGEEYDVLFNATGATETPVAFSFTNHETTLLWSTGLRRTEFPRLKELDLRFCSIQVLGPGLFQGMKNLKNLYIGENEIYHVDAEAFLGLENLHHLDFSRNRPLDQDGNLRGLGAESYNIFANLTNLVSLDLSHSKLISRNFGVVGGLGLSIKSLSLCNTGLMNIREGTFDKMSLQVLDISRNNGILGMAGKPFNLQGLEKSLIVLYANEIGLQSIDSFKGFTKLEILQLASNEIYNIKSSVTRTLTNLQVLDLNKNRLTSWSNATYSVMPKLRMLLLRDNNINIISEQMIEDMKNVDYLALSGNSLVCNCHAKDFYEMTAFNEDKYNNTRIRPSSKTDLFHIGYYFYNALILNRKPVKYTCVDNECEDIEDTGRFRLVDYFPGGYTCLRVTDSHSLMFGNVTSCYMGARDQSGYKVQLESGKKTLLVLLVIPFLMLPTMIIFVFRRNLRYCLVTVRNSAMLSLINKNEVIEDGTIFNYDVFVSYCNEDRGWVLDHLLPHIESDCSISVCLHERDFQVVLPEDPKHSALVTFITRIKIPLIENKPTLNALVTSGCRCSRTAVIAFYQVGLSILENIVSCMDRSRSIMLIISQRFLLSQWCQFEMHLAQHRLLETRREDLILVLLEDIPRRLRPNTLHYLMLTKTYIVWPKTDSDRLLFWKRLKKSLLQQKVKQTENASLA